MSYRTSVPGTSTPSIARKWGTQAPVPPMATADRVSQLDH